MMATSNGGENEKLKLVELHLLSGNKVCVNLSDQEILMAHQALSNPEAVLTVDSDGERYMIPVRQIYVMQIKTEVTNNASS